MKVAFIAVLLSADCSSCYPGWTRIEQSHNYPTTQLSLLIVVTHLTLSLTLPPCPDGYFLDVNSSISHNQSATCSAFPIDFNSTYVVTLFNDSSIVISNSNHSHSVYWLNFFKQLNNFTLRLAINSNTPLMMSCYEYPPSTLYSDGFNGSLPDCNLIAISLTSPPSYSYLRFLWQSDGSTLVWDIIDNEASWYIGVIMITLCVNPDLDCKPCPATCPLCFGDDPQHNCLSPCNASLSSNFSHYNCSPLIQSANSSLPSISLTSSIAVVTNLSPSLILITSSFLQFNSLQSLLIMISLSTTIYNLQFLNTSLASSLSSLFTPPLILQYLSPNYWITSLITSQYSSLPNFINTPTSFTTNFAMPFFLSLILLIASHYSHSLYRKLRKLPPLKSPPHSLLSLIFVITLSNSQNLILYSLINLAYLINPPSHQPMTPFDHLNLILVIISLTLLVASYRSLLHSVITSLVITTLISQLFQIIYIFFITFSSHFTAEIQSIIILILFLSWSASYLIIYCFTSLKIRSLFSLDANNFYILQLIFLSHLITLSLIQLFDIDNMVLLTSLIISSQIGVIIVSLVLPTISLAVTKINRKRDV